VSKKTTGVKLAWAAALALYAACWVLPILKEAIGFDGARFAHEEFWRLLTEGRAIKSAGDVFAVVFFAVGWLANELFLLGLATLSKWPRVAVRCLAFSLSIMISWQIAFVEEFPLLIGYWFWVAAGAIMLWLAADRAARETRRGLGAVLAEPVTLALLLAPTLNAVMARALSN
jgi:hypothetical protein